MARIPRIGPRSIVFQNIRVLREIRGLLPSGQAVAKKQATTCRRTRTESAETHIDEYLQAPQRRASLLREARQAAHESTVLACGFVGPGNGSISIDEPLAKDERLKWKREIEWRDQRMAEMEKRLMNVERQVTELKEARQAQKELALRGERAIGSQAPPGNEEQRVNGNQPLFSHKWMNIHEITMT